MTIQHAATHSDQSDDHARADLALERRMRIVEALNSRGSTTIAELAGLLGMSPATVRRDLTWLDQRGILTRTRGGAVAAGHLQQFTRRYESSLDLRQHEHAEEKQAIGRLAAEMVNDSQTIMIDGGSTTCAMVPFLAKKQDLLIITNSLLIMNALARLENPSITVVLTGGQYRSRSSLFVGTLAEYALTQFFADITFLGLAGVSVENGLTDPSIEVIPIKRQMIKAAKQVVVLADYSKFGHTYSGLIAPLSTAHMIITDEHAANEHVRQIASKGPQVLIARG